MPRFSLFLVCLFFIYIPSLGGIGEDAPILSPYSGRLLMETSMERPIMVVVENAAPARPQAGLEDAEIIYEFLVEGGITRLLALFFNHSPQKVGPIRSARPYLLMKALEYDPIFLHIGGSAAAYHLLSQVPLDNIDELGAGSSYYWRSNDRRPPYNLYTDLQHISHLTEEGQSTLEPFFHFQTSPPSLMERESLEITIPYWGGYRVTYIYQEERGEYLRYCNTLPHYTQEGVHLKTHNLLILYISTRVLDEAGRLDLNLDEGGPLLFFRDGLALEGTWRREAGRTYYLDEEGEDLLFQRGITWINVVPMSTTIKY